MAVEKFLKEHPTEYLTIKQFVERYPWPTESAMRSIVQKAEERGFNRAIKRYRRRVLIDTAEFFACLERMQENETNTCSPNMKKG